MNIKRLNIKIWKAQVDDWHEPIKKTIWPQDLSFVNFPNIAVDATAPGIHTADA